jgi:hypothetical protein
LWRDLMEAIADGRPAEAADIGRAIDIRPGVALLDLEAAKAFAAEGRAEEARERLGAARAFWTKVAATHYLEKADTVEADLPARAEAASNAAVAGRRRRS